MAENKNINAETLEAEAHGFFKGERKNKLKTQKKKSCSYSKTKACQ